MWRYFSGAESDSCQVRFEHATLANISDNIAQFGQRPDAAIQTLPDMVIASAELDKITGIDLPLR